MRTEDFDYELPPERIAQRPAQPRDSSRLMVLARASGEVQHRIFRQLPELLTPGDLLVLNETRVLPARLEARKIPGGGKAELLLLSKEAPAVWTVLVGGKGLRPGRRVEVVGGPHATILENLGGPRRRVRFNEPVEPLLDEIGAMPLPPYIERPLRDPEEYQTVYGRRLGSAAAPTAGLHFTPELLEKVQSEGIGLARLTLHVGMDTFAPVHEEDPEEHPIHTEWCELTQETADRINAARRRGNRVVAVGTTSVRALETAARNHEATGLSAFEGPTDLYILPGFQFRIVDALITNFHLPRSTLLMLVSAFAGRETILNAYEVAKWEGYRFYSFGDAMLIL